MELYIDLSLSLSLSLSSIDRYIYICYPSIYLIFYVYLAEHMALLGVTELIKMAKIDQCYTVESPEFRHMNI